MSRRQTPVTRVDDEATAAPGERLKALLRFPVTDRIENLRLFSASSDIDWVGEIDYERIVTRVYRETEGDPIILRRARTFAGLCREYPISIEDTSLLVGYLFKGRATRPHGLSWNGKSLKTVSAGLTEMELEEYKRELEHYWEGPDGRCHRTRYGQTYQRYTNEQKNLFFADPDSYPQTPSFIANADYCRIPHVAHTEIQQEKLLRIGLRGFVREAEERLARLDPNDPTTYKQGQFLQGVIIGLEAACEVGPRFARLAREMAANETDQKRALELQKVAEINEKVPAAPPDTLWEALQCLWTVHFLHWWETPTTGGITQGRLDQYLYPYYAQDIAAGRITEEEALELIDCLFLKFAEAHGVTGLKGVGDDRWVGDPIAHHIDVGGIKPEDGSDATNELSYLFLESVLHTRSCLPNVGILLHRDTPGKFIRRALECVSLGLPQPYFFNAETLVRMALARAAELGGPPVTLEMARKYGPVGCAEPGVRGLDGGYVGSGDVGVCHAVELVLNRGVNPYHRRRMGPDTGDPRTFKTFDEFRFAFEQQVQHMMELVGQGCNIGEIVTAEMEPTVFQSALIGDCIEKAVPREEGGSRYTHGGAFGIMGTPDAANSLYAIKELVFDDEKISMDALCRALEANFVGHENVRHLCLGVPKYGNDLDGPDEMHAYVLRTLAQMAHRLQNPRGGKRGVCEVPLMWHVLTGRTLGAMPNGRLAGTPVSDGVSPNHGTDTNGPVAVLKSVGKSAVERIDCGSVLNMRLSPDVFKSEAGYQFGAGILRTFVETGGFHLQFNVVSNETLRAAQQEPERHKDLMVRVTGYAAYFVELPTEFQESVIARMEHGI